MELSEEVDDVGLILRHVSRQFPEALARALVPGLEPVVVAGWVDAQVSGRQRCLDRALEVAVGGKRLWIHLEWQLEMDADMALRVYEFHVLFALALADEAGLGRSPPAIDSVVVLLSGREEPWPAQGEYCTSVPEGPFCGVRCRIEPVYQRTVGELMGRDNPLWLMFAPLAHQFERRLGRLPSPAEHAALVQRLGTLGPARLGDLVLDLTPEALATWLAAPDGS